MQKARDIFRIPHSQYIVGARAIAHIESHQLVSLRLAYIVENMISANSFSLELITILYIIAVCFVIGLIAYSKQRVGLKLEYEKP